MLEKERAWEERRLLLVSAIFYAMPDYERAFLRHLSSVLFNLGFDDRKEVMNREDNSVREKFSKISQERKGK